MELSNARARLCNMQHFDEMAFRPMKRSHLYECPSLFRAGGSQHEAPRRSLRRGPASKFSWGRMRSWGGPSRIAPIAESIQSQLGEAACRPFDKRASLWPGGDAPEGGLGGHRSTDWSPSIQPPRWRRLLFTHGGSALLEPVPAGPGTC